jgi:hypothetical protein
MRQALSTDSWWRIDEQIRYRVDSSGQSPHAMSAVVMDDLHEGTFSPPAVEPQRYGCAGGEWLE